MLLGARWVVWDRTRFRGGLRGGEGLAKASAPSLRLNYSDGHSRTIRVTSSPAVASTRTGIKIERSTCVVHDVGEQRPGRASSLGTWKHKRAIPVLGDLGSTEGKNGDDP